MMRNLIFSLTVMTSTAAFAQTPPPQMPAEYVAVLQALGRQGDYKDNVLKVNIPRSDLKVTVDGVATPTPFGFGGWIALTKGDHGMDVMMGDLVLTEAEVNPVMSAVLDNGLEVSALHNHFVFDSPRMFYMHVHGHGAAADIAKKLQPALAMIGKTPSANTAAGAPGRAIDGKLDTDALAKTIGTPGEQNGAVYKITIGRSDFTMKEMGAVAGDVAMLASEVTPVLKALRANGIDVVAIHHHMTGTTPNIFFLHYWGKGPAAKLASGVKAAVAQLAGPRR